MQNQNSEDTYAPIKDASITQSFIQENRELRNLSCNLADPNFVDLFQSIYLLNKINDRKKQAKIRLGKLLKGWQKRYHLEKVKAILCFTFIFLSVFQTPVWCNQNDQVKSNSSKNSCKNEKKLHMVSTYFMPNLPFYLTEILITLALTVYDILELCCFELKPRRKNFIIGASILTILLLINDIVVIVDNSVHWNFSKIIKPLLFVCYIEIFQVTLLVYYKIIIKGKDIYLMLLFCLIFYFGLGLAIFKWGTNEESAQANLPTSLDYCNTTLSQFEKSQSIFCQLLILFQLQTSVTSPDSYLAYYNQHSWYLWYFASFQLLNTLLIINLFLVFFYSTFRTIMEQLAERHVTNQLNSVAKENCLYRSEIKIRHVVINHNQTADSLEFSRFRMILDNKYLQLAMEIIHIGIFSLLWFKIEHLVIQIFILILNSLVFLELFLLSKDLGTFPKMGKFKHCLEFFITITILVLTTLYMVTTWKKPIYIGILMSTRLIRGSQFIMRSKTFVYLFQYLLSHLSSVMMLFAMLFVLSLVFSAIGEYCFGGRIVGDLPQILNGDKQFENYHLINFNDFLSGLVTCWFLMFVNNWNKISYFYAISMQTDNVYIYFIAFYIVVVLLALNVTMAFLVDFLVTKWRKNHKPSETGFSYDDII